MSHSASAGGPHEPGLARLSVDLTTTPTGAVISYRSSNDDEGQISFDYGFNLSDEDKQMLQPIALGAAVFLGQLSLARTIELGFPTDLGAVATLMPLAEMLYDVRCWKDKLPPIPPPVITATESARWSPIRQDVDPERAVLLWSGGKDSTLSSILLSANRFDVHPVHMSANTGVEEQESEAVRALAQQLDVSPIAIEYEYPQYLDFSSKYAVEWNGFPLWNTVAFGRDMFLPLVALPVARVVGAGVISMGHDHECRSAYIENYFGKRIPRNDVESTEGALVLESFIRTYCIAGTMLLPPIAQMNEWRVLSEMFINHSELMALASFCFWPGNNCGRCAKCLRYYLAQRVLGVEVLNFDVNPLSDEGSPELGELIREWGEGGALFQKQVWYCLGRLVQRGDIRVAEDALREFESTVYSAIADRLDAWEEELLMLSDDPQVPDEFVV